MSAYQLDVPELRRRLDARRQERGLTWRQLAEQVDISPSMFSRLADDKRPDADALVTLLVWLDLDTDIAIMIKPKEQP
ncbi:helix-turn-helix domain-containing protein [Streptomyces collinus]|uniref:helix-turn-helix domain-containing protein n=1 Tax=Streptomyces collinus TaxID=42684 RepID=UPI0037F612A1